MVRCLAPAGSQGPIKFITLMCVLFCKKRCRVWETFDISEKQSS